MVKKAIGTSLHFILNLYGEILNFVRSKCKDREGNLTLRLKLFWTKVRSILVAHYLNLASFQIYILKVNFVSFSPFLNFACFRCQRNAVVMGEGRLLW